MPSAGRKEWLRNLAIVFLPPRRLFAGTILTRRTVEEIAEMLAIPIGTVKSRLHHARIALHAVLLRKENKR